MKREFAIIAQHIKNLELLRHELVRTVGAAKQDNLVPFLESSLKVVALDAGIAALRAQLRTVGP